MFAELGKRFSFGGQAGSDQRIYYINTRELTGNKYGTPNPVPFRVVDQRAGIDIDIGIRCFGEYSYRVVNPILFYTNVCGNVENAYTRDAKDGKMPRRLSYPISESLHNAVNYQEAIERLGGRDDWTKPVWWDKNSTY